MKFTKRIMSMLLAFALTLGLCPQTAWAAEETQAATEIPETTMQTEAVETTEETVPETTAAVEEVPAETAEVTATETAEAALASAETASGTCGDNLTWTLIDGVLTISGQGSMPNYKFDAPWYDLRSNITCAIICDGVTTIGKYAFYFCKNLEQISLPDSLVSIEYGAFYECSSLTEIIIPENVANIAGGAFCGCSSLSNIFVSERNTSYSIGDNGELYNIEKTHIIWLSPKYSGRFNIPDGVTNIECSAFYQCRALTEVTIPKSVTNIGDNAFSMCSGLIKMLIPDSVTGIGDYAFSHCSSLAEVILPSSVTSLESGVFCWCTSLTEIILPDSVTRIGGIVFDHCRNLSEIIIPNSVTYIGDHAFSDCSNLTEIVIPASVTNIGSSAFFNCNKLSKVEIPKSITLIRSYTFRDCTSIPELTIPDGVTRIYNYSFQRCSGLTCITIPESVTAIDDYAFDACFNLSDVYYGGTKEQWNSISIGIYNECLTAATIHYNSNGLDSYFESGTDDFSFLNSATDFFTAEEIEQDSWNQIISWALQLKQFEKNYSYQISDEAFRRLSAGMSNTVISNLMSKKANSWGGSCFGMSTVAAIRYIDEARLPINKIDSSIPGTGSTYDLLAPASSENTENLINYYHLTQYLPLRYAIEQSNRALVSSNYTEAITRIINKLNNHSPVLVGILSDNSGHAVLLLDVLEENEEYYKLEVYDPNFTYLTSMNLYKSAESTSDTLRIAYSSSANVDTDQITYSKICLYIDDIYQIDMRNYFGYDSNYLFTDYEHALFKVKDDTNIHWDAGDSSLVYQNGTVISSENVYGPYFDYTDGNPSGAVYFTVDYSDITADEIICELEATNGGACDVEITLEDWSVFVNSEQSTAISIDTQSREAAVALPSEGFISLLTTQDEVSADWSWHTAAIDLENATNATISHAEAGITIESNCLDNAMIALKNDKEVITENISSDTPIVQITENDNEIEVTPISALSGDLNRDSKVTEADAVYLVWHTLFPAQYPVGADADFDGSGAVDASDAVHLLWHTLFPALYPL